jgi:hypothetical protein
MDSQSKNGLTQSDEVNALHENTFKGPQVAVGNGHARTFVTINHDGVPQEIGVVFTHGALSGLATVNTPYVLRFHNKALEATPFNTLQWDGAPMDIHFQTVSWDRTSTFAFL